MDTKLKITLMAVVVLAIIAVFRVTSQLQTMTPAPVLTPETVSVETAPGITDVTEQYQGVIGTTTIVFEHIDYVEYRYVMGDVVRSGELNTERGFGDDLDATVYVLDWERPEAEQLRFLRPSAEPDTLYQISEDGQVVLDWMLTLQ